MSVGCWNIRGCRRPNALEEVKSFCLVNNISIMMLCETKSPLPPSDGCVKRTGFSFCDFVPTQGFAGGVWLLWKDDVANPYVLSVISKSSRYIACSIKFLVSDIQFVIIFIYAPPHANAKDTSRKRSICVAPFASHKHGNDAQIPFASHATMNRRTISLHKHHIRAICVVPY